MKHLILIGVLALGLFTTAQAANEGIKVHGHWQLDIYNKDGSFDRKVEFENALALADGFSSSGSDLLVAMLLGTRSVGMWSIEIIGVNGLCSNAQDNCYMTSQNNISTDNIVSFDNLVVSELNGTMVLSGSVVIGGNNQIDTVNTSIGTCLVENFLNCQGASGASFNFNFTSKDLSANPVAVQAGQTVNVTVTISFS